MGKIKQAEENSQQEPQAPTLESKVRDAIDKWYAGELHNSVVSRDTDVHNLIHEAKPKLIELVTAAVGQTTTEE